MTDPTTAATPRPALTLGQRLFILLGSIGPIGHMPASGTAAVLFAGLPLVYVMQRYLSPTAYAVVTIVFTLVAMPVHHRGDQLLGESDSGKLVWDELAGIFIAMFLVPWTWKTATAGFFLERAIDTIKPPPARKIDDTWHNGVGVVLDDVIAGIYTCIIMHLGLWLL